MKSIIDELWFGNLYPIEQCVDGNRDVKELIALMGKNRDRLTEEMSEEKKDILGKYDDCINEMNTLIEKEAFAYGFRIAAKMMIEVFCK